MNKVELYEKLKKYWKVDEFKFIAKFERPRDNEGNYVGEYGYFIQFVDYETARPIRYPKPKGNVPFDTRVSIKQRVVKGLVHDNYYLMVLDIDESLDSKNNPFKLKIIEIGSLNQSDVEAYYEQVRLQNKKEIEAKGDFFKSLLESNGIRNNLFYGQYIINDKGNGHLQNIISVDEGNLLLFQGRRLQVFIKKGFLNLVENGFYSFKLKSAEETKNGGVLLYIDKADEPRLLDNNPYREIIRLRFERLDNPESNRMIANLMREIGKGLYSSKQRMIFELLQNADDAPADDSIKFHVNAEGDYLFIMHNGAPFSRDDVEAITSAAESTKRNDSKKTGYKGIGFKSVFTDSQEVIIQTGGFLFAFQRFNPIFNDFDKFYFSKDRYRKYPDLLIEDQKKFQKQRREFSGVRDIPWQVVPIWQDDLPQEIKTTDFGKYGNNVKIAIKFGRNKLDGYLQAIEEFAESPQFILFLRNTSFFHSPKNNVRIIKEGDNPVKIIKQLPYNKSIELTYYKVEVPNIPVTNESLADMGIDLIKANRKNDYGEISYYFTNSNGDEIENIPPKLAAYDTTQIVFAIPIIESKIAAEPRYIKRQSFSSLFTYLPMEEKRFQLPFLVNADFVPSSDREKIQGDNPWNIYIMAKIALEHIRLLEVCASKFDEKKEVFENYLSLLLKAPFDDDFTAQVIIDKYNDVYLEKIKTAEIVVSDTGELKTIGETIIDNSGFSQIFENELFYKLYNTEKCLPSEYLNSEFLSFSYLEIEKVKIKDIAQNISGENISIFASAVLELDAEQYAKLLEWLDKVAEIAVERQIEFGEIPFLIHNHCVYSINDLIELDEVWIINENTIHIEEIIKELDFDTINLDLNEHSNIDYFIKSSSNYTNDSNLAYERIASSESLSKLSAAKKNDLILFLEDTSGFMAGIGETKYLKELKLFNSGIGVAHALSELLEPSDAVLNSTLQDYAMLQEEYDLLPERLKNKTIVENKVFEDFMLNSDLYLEWVTQFNSDSILLHVEEVDKWYSFVGDKESISISQISRIPWLFIDDEARFQLNDNIYCPTSLYKLPKEKYQLVRSVVSLIYEVPLFDSTRLIELLKLKVLESEITPNLDADITFDLESANVFLDWLVDNKEVGFFNNWHFERGEEEAYLLAKHSGGIVAISNGRIYQYIDKYEELNKQIYKLQKELYSPKLMLIGLKTGDEILRFILSTEFVSQELAVFMNLDTPNEIVLEFLKKLPELRLYSNIKYDKNTAEHNIISFLLKFIEEEDFLSDFNKKVFIDDVSLLKQNTLDLVSFKINEKKYELQLSKILPDEYEGKSNAVSGMIESFTDQTKKSTIRDKIFKTHKLEVSEIYSAIKQLNTEYVDPYKLVFLLLYRYDRGIQLSSALTGVVRFDKYFEGNDEVDKLRDSYKSFLNILSGISLTDLGGFKFIDLCLKELVYHDYFIEKERIPEWLQEWIDADSNNTRTKYLTRLGLNTGESTIVKYRKALINNSYRKDFVELHFDKLKVNNIQLLWNSVEWLAQYKSAEFVTRNIGFIEYTLDNYKPSTGEDLFIPIITKVNKNEEGENDVIYELVKAEEGETFHISTNWDEWIEDIVTYLNNIGEYIIDDKCFGDVRARLTTIEKLPEKKPDIELLNKKSSRYSELFYKKWEGYDDNEIYIYEGKEIPWIVEYIGNIVNRFTKGENIYIEEKAYVVIGLESRLLLNLPDDFPEDAKQSLIEWKIKTDEDPSLLDSYEPEYSEEIERLIRDRLGIPIDEQRSVNTDARVAAVYYLEKEGYDVSEISSKIKYLIDGIIDSEGNKIACIVRSAKGGLLYMDDTHWDAFKYSDVILIIIFPGGEPQLFKTREELLANELNEYLLFRTRNSRDPELIDKLFEQVRGQESHLMMVTSTNMREKLYDKFKKAKKNNPVSDRAKADEDFDID